jgi:hypothetical protein
VRLGSASNVAVGGTAAGAGNTIAFNAGRGVELDTTAGMGNAILGNAVHSNGSLGIDLAGDGVTANDAGDADARPNNRQNFPVLSAAMTTGAGRVIFAGSLNGAASTTYRVEFFASSSADPTGYGEGARYLDSANVATNPSGNASIAVALAASVAAGEFVTATATDPFNNTSEFGNAIQAVVDLVVTTTADGAPDGDTSSVSALITNPGPAGRISLREAITATNNPAGCQTSRFGIPHTDTGHVYQDSRRRLRRPTQTTCRPADALPVDYSADYPAGTAGAGTGSRCLAADITIP